MAHGVQLEILESDLLHLMIGRVIFDAVSVATIPVALLQHRRVAIHDARQTVKLAAGHFTETPHDGLEMRVYVSAGVDT